ncbi:hypothetical protein STANM337S_06501 [Streptomyces tanashiensis]
MRFGCCASQVWGELFGKSGVVRPGQEGGLEAPEDVVLCGVEEGLNHLFAARVRQSGQVGQENDPRVVGDQVVEQLRVIDRKAGSDLLVLGENVAGRATAGPQQLAAHLRRDPVAEELRRQVLLIAAMSKDSATLSDGGEQR